MTAYYGVVKTKVQVAPVQQVAEKESGSFRSFYMKMSHLNVSRFITLSADR